MARKTDADARAAAAAAELRGERELNTAINNAVASTEDEIFRDALSDEPLDLDGDRTLEAMEDDIGEQVVDEDEEDQELDEDGDEELDEDEDGDTEVDTEIDEDGDEALAARDRGDRRQDDRGIPPGRVREMRQRDRQQADDETERLRYDLSVTQARLNDVVTQLGQRGAQPGQQQQEQQRQEPEVPPDMFSDPDGFRQYLVREATKEATRVAEERVGKYSQDQQQTEMQRVNESLVEAAEGPRRFEFHEAYRQLTSLPKNAESARIVQAITKSRDPATALFDWFEDNGAEDFRASVAEQLGFEVERPQRGRDDGGRRPAPRQARDDYDERPAPRHEVRLPQSMRGRMPSLNEARGASRAERDSDPRGFDGSDHAIFDYAASR